MKIEIKKLRDAYGNEIFAAENAVIAAMQDQIDENIEAVTDKAMQGVLKRQEARKVLSGERVLDLSDDAAMQLWEKLNKVGFDVVF